MDNKNRDDFDAPVDGFDAPVDGFDAPVDDVAALPDGSFRLPRPSGDLRQSILEQTEQVLTFRTRRRFLIKLTVLAAAYLGGIATTFLVMERPTQDREEIATAEDSPSKTADVFGDPADDFGDPADDFGDPADDPGELVQRAQSAAPGERTRLLERAGDLYLADRCDVEEALRCYRWALNAMPASKQTVVEPDDSWLLAALKDSRR